MNTPNPNSYDYSLFSLIQFLWDKKLLLTAIPLAISVLVALWTLTLTNTYLSEATLSPTDEVQGAGLGNMSGQLGGLASLAGFSVGAESTNQVTVALEILKSRKFIADFVNHNQLKPLIMAVESWDKSSNKLVFDPDIYDVETKTWTREVTDGRSPEPTDQEIYAVFTEKMTAERDNSTGLIKVTIEHYSPHIARQWVSLMVAMINQEMRQREIGTATENIHYLKSKVAEIDDIEMTNVFYQLIQEQTKSLMLAEVRSDYAFTVIDPPVAPELKFAPKRSLIVVFVGFLTGFLVLGGLTVWFLIVPKS